MKERSGPTPLAVPMTPENEARSTLMEIERALIETENDEPERVDPTVQDQTAAIQREAALKKLIEAEVNKVDAIAGLMHRLKADAEFCANEAVALSDRSERLLRRRKRLERYVLDIMEMFSRKKIEGQRFTMTRLEGRTRVEVEREKLPTQYWRQPPLPDPVPDLTSIGAALRGGVKIEGAELVAGDSTLRVYH